MEVTEQARHTYNVIILYNKNTNMVTQDNGVGIRIRKKMQNKLVKTWNPSPKGWYRWNTDTSRIVDRQSTIIGIMCIQDKCITRMENKLVTVQFFLLKL